ncbi:toll/interleukin-1 receptor domain-containing adapter protein [Cheilinus undulatus]|uniref:toll/interleukin-1 receptor domain-containing adapter protein n=1 Tax=Cheilinus undulatus TaxID=241271 RepID=UPI001BD36CBE|nr:toll/interleukin-1 receptor domain-containing adapter protein [Cheilinus undulatus]
MHCWLQKLLKSKGPLSAQHGAKARVAQSSTSSSSSAALSSLGTAPSKPLQPSFALSSPQRWSRKYDVLVCHSSVDSDAEEAQRLVSFLEASSSGFRCFLRERDSCPGGAISTELCDAVENSHLWALLITPSFLQDNWCQFVTQQALSEGPMSHRTIPLVKNLHRSQVPRELRFFFNIDLNNNPDRGYNLLHRTVLCYLEELVKKYKDT